MEKYAGKPGWYRPVKYTLAADLNHDICQAYDVESEGGVARGAFLIDNRALFAPDRQ